MMLFKYRRNKISQITSLPDTRYYNLNYGQFKRLSDLLKTSRLINWSVVINIILDLDSTSNTISFQYLWKAIELEDALNWLSTLGGAYSNLGDHSREFAVLAGENATKQMNILLRYSDAVNPSILCKCWLFVAMSLMQVKRLKKCRVILVNIHRYYNENSEFIDDKIFKMTLGIYARLKHIWLLNKK